MKNNQYKIMYVKCIYKKLKVLSESESPRIFNNFNQWKVIDFHLTMIYYQSGMTDCNTRNQSLIEIIKSYNWFRFRERKLDICYY